MSLAAGEGIRLVALELLRAATEAGDELANSHSEEALHRFRVALRRLRSWLRAFRSELKGTVRRKDRDKLRAIAHATNLGRDTDVQLSWLRGAAKGWSRKRKQGADWLAQYLSARQRHAGDPVDSALLGEFRDVAKDLAQRLAVVEKRLDGKAAPVALSHALADHLAPHTNELGAALKKVRVPSDEAQAHKARIAAKRLRYLMEQAVPYVKTGGPLLERLKSLQDELGALHDVHVMGHQIRNALEASAVTEAHRLSDESLGSLGGNETANDTDDLALAPLATAVIPLAPRDAVLTVARRLKDDTSIAFARLRKDWGNGQYAKFSRDVSVFRKRLSKSVG